MPRTLLAVDDSATMRKVLEITFGGEDYQVTTAPNRNDALGKVGENPSVVVIDTVLDGDDGYALAKEVRGRLPRAALILLSSRYHPYDQAKGRDAGADDYMDKPFDTQQLLEKVKKALAAKEAGGAAVSAEPTAGTPYRAPAPVAHPPTPQPAPVRPVASPAAPPVQPMAAKGFEPGPPKQRSATLMFPLDAPAAQPRAEQPPPEVPTHHEPQTAVPPPPKAAPAAAIAAPVNGQMAAKLSELGLTPAQADAVMALSREVVERVVWEVVPQLAETMIKEEIARLMKE